MNKISVVIITKNEADHIERCLASVSWADEVIVYDSLSGDQTVEIAKKLGARVTVGDWKGFGPTKQLATHLAANDWILSIDADEEVPIPLRDEIRAKLQTLDPATGYRVPRLSYFLGRWIRHGGWFPDYQLRLFNKKHAGWSHDLIHERVEAPCTGIFLNHINHYVFKNIEHQVTTNNRYSTLQAEALHAAGRSFCWFHFLTKPTVKFMECYFWKLGLLDGWPGLLIAFNAGYSVLLKWAKLKELTMRRIPRALG